MVGEGLSKENILKVKKNGAFKEDCTLEYVLGFPEYNRHTMRILKECIKEWRTHRRKLN